MKRMVSTMKRGLGWLLFYGCGGWCMAYALGGEPQEAEWATYHGDAALRGIAACRVPDKPEMLWRFKADAPITGAPVVGGGRVHFATRRGTVYAVDLKGNKVWAQGVTVVSQAPDGKTREQPERFQAPAMLVDGLVVIGGMSGQLYALGAADGTVKWKYDAGGGIQGTANYARVGKRGECRLIVLTQPDGAPRAIDPATGAEIWKKEGPARCDGSPAVGADRIAYGSCAAALHLYAVEDGGSRGNIEFGEGKEVAGGVAIDAGQVFTGSREGALFCVALETKTIVWTNADGDGDLFTTPAVAADRVVFAPDNGRVYCVDRATGKTVWTFEPSGSAQSPVIAGDRVVLAAENKVYILDMKDGNALWSYDAGDGLTSPAVAGGMILVGAREGHVVAFGAASGTANERE